MGEFNISGLDFAGLNNSDDSYDKSFDEFNSDDVFEEQSYELVANVITDDHLEKIEVFTFINHLNNRQIKICYKYDVSYEQVRDIFNNVYATILSDVVIDDNNEMHFESKKEDNDKFLWCSFNFCVSDEDFNWFIQMFQNLIAVREIKNHRK